MTGVQTCALPIFGNFYTGGFTGAGAWDDPKGIVHSNEFVANRFAVANPAVRPVLDLLDHAQRSGSISNLSSADIAAVSGGAYSSPSAAGGRYSANTVSPSAGVDNKILQECIQVMRQVKERFEGDIVAEVAITGKRGIKKVTGDYDKLIKNVRR